VAEESITTLLSEWGRGESAQTFCRVNKTLAWELTQETFLQVMRGPTSCVYLGPKSITNKMVGTSAHYAVFDHCQLVYFQLSSGSANGNRTRRLPVQFSWV
jgi:hypothetical protein